MGRSTPDKQAVVLIHGIGEQMPMATLRDFVDAIWKRNEDSASTVWSKPDTISRNFELRRLTTSRNLNGIRTDFFEFYWADLMHGTRWRHVRTWMRRVLWRRPRRVPEHLRGIWWIIVVLVAGVIGLGAWGVHAFATKSWRIPFLAVIGVGFVLSVAWSLVLRHYVTGYVGDAARYMHPLPDNVHRRHAIRARGVELLKRLHDSGAYARIIVVGHSLGSVIGYDILTHAWPACNTVRTGGGSTDHAALDVLEQLAQSGTASAERIQSVQRALAREERRNGNGWLVTDFVTLGSPLAHADILLAEDAQDLRIKQVDREFPTCPPMLENSRAFSFTLDGQRVLHHAAVSDPLDKPLLPRPLRRLGRRHRRAAPLSLRSWYSGCPPAQPDAKWSVHAHAILEDAGKKACTRLR